VAVASAGPYASHFHLPETGNYTSTSLLNFYRQNALHDTQPTVYHQCQSIKSKKLAETVAKLKHLA